MAKESDIKWKVRLTVSNEPSVFYIYTRVRLRARDVAKIDHSTTMTV